MSVRSNESDGSRTSTRSEWWRIFRHPQARGNRRLPYRGTHANDRWLHHRAAALNLRRLVNLGLTHLNNTWTLTATPWTADGPPPADLPTKIFRTLLYGQASCAAD